MKEIDKRYIGVPTEWNGQPAIASMELGYEPGWFIKVIYDQDGELLDSTHGTYEDIAQSIESNCVGPLCDKLFPEDIDTDPQEPPKEVDDDFDER